MKSPRPRPRRRGCHSLPSQAHTHDPLCLWACRSQGEEALLGVLPHQHPPSSRVAYKLAQSSHFPIDLNPHHQAIKQHNHTPTLSNTLSAYLSIRSPSKLYQSSSFSHPSHDQQAFSTTITTTTTIKMPSRESYIPVSVSPPTDISSYARYMHQHTKRQMEAASRSSHRRSGNMSPGGTPSIPNGVSSSSSSGSPNAVHEYHD